MPSLETRLRPLLRAVGYFGADATRARTVSALFKSCALQAAHPNWAKRSGIDTKAFRPRHALVFAHVWLVHRAFETVGASTKRARGLLQEELFDELWEDTQERIRVEGVAEISVNKHLTDVQKYSFQAALEYDDASARTGADRRDALGAAVWRHVYLAKEDAEEDKCLAVADYLLARLDSNILAEQPDEVDWRGAPLSKG